MYAGLKYIEWMNASLVMTLLSNIVKHNKIDRRPEEALLLAQVWSWISSTKTEQ